MKLRIKEVIKEKGLTIQALADQMNINRVNLSASINGNPTVETLEKIASALEVDITALFASTNECGVHGFIKIKGTVYEVQSFDDLEKLLKMRG